MLGSRAVLISYLSAALLAAGLSSCRRNRPPDTPTVPVGPGLCFKDTTYAFRTTVTDPDGDSVSVRFIGFDTMPSDWTGWFPSGDTIAMSHAWSDTGTYLVRAAARDLKGLGSFWSGELTVRVVNRRPPAQPAAPTGPGIGGQDSSYAFAAAAFHPDNINVSIRFSWGDSIISDWSPFVASGESVVMSHAWLVPDSFPVTVQAKDTGDALSQWSAPHTIVIRPPDTLLKWRFQLLGEEGSPLYSSPAIGPDGTIYVGAPDSSVYAVNPDGTFKWRYRTGDGIRSAPAIGSDGTVYIGSEDDHLYAIAPDGALRWSYATTGSIYSSPAIGDGGTVYVGSLNHWLYAVNPEGTLKWLAFVGDRPYSSPAVGSDGTIYVGSNDQFLYALNPDSTLRWRYQTGQFVRSSPAVAGDGTVYFGSDDFFIYALNPDGTVRWRYQTGRDVQSSPAIGPDGTVYVGSQDDYLYALNPGGTLRWRYQTGGNVDASPAIAADGTIYCGSDDGFLYAVNPDSTLKWRYETGSRVESSPTIGPDGTVYFTSGNGYLYALKGTAALASSAWPKFHHDLANTGRAGGP